MKAYNMDNIKYDKCFLKILSRFVELLAFIWRPFFITAQRRVIGHADLVWHTVRLKSAKRLFMNKDPPNKQGCVLKVHV